MPSGKRVQKKMPALARVQRLGHQRCRGGQRRPARLQLQQRARGLHFRAVEAGMCRRIELRHHRVRKLVG